MTTWEFGLTEQPYDAVKDGSKTIEGRLKQGKFVEFRPGDIVKVRRDFVRVGDEESELHVKVVAVREYANFSELCRQEEFQRVVPWTSTGEEAIDSYGEYYSVAAQTEYGVLAIEVRVI